MGFRPNVKAKVVEPGPKKQRRGSEELTMRKLIIPRLRERWPNARIVHELPLRYSTNRIDLAAITPDEIIGVEIKSSVDVADRLEKQVRNFLPICSQVIVALAPKWNARLSSKQVDGPRHTMIIPQFTAAQTIINRINDSSIEVWTVDVENKSVTVTDQSYIKNTPWADRMLHVLWADELRTIAARHQIAAGDRAPHRTLNRECNNLMKGREVVSAVCRALRERDAFGAGSDQPIIVRALT